MVSLAVSVGWAFPGEGVEPPSAIPAAAGSADGLVVTAGVSPTGRRQSQTGSSERVGAWWGSLGGLQEARLRTWGRLLAFPPRALCWGPLALGCSPKASGHTHRLLVPAGLAGVLEAGKLAVPAGPAVLVNDALLGAGQGGSFVRKGRSAAHQAPQKGKAPFIPCLRVPRLRAQKQTPSPAALPGSLPSLPSIHSPRRAGPHPHGVSRLLPSGMPLPVHTIASVCSLPSHTGWEARRPRAGLQHRADGFNKKS